MKNSQRRGSHGRKHSIEPMIQVICLASGGGPSESDVTGFLVRSVSEQWSKGSVLAVDAGAHLAALVRMLEKDFPLISSMPSHDSASSLASVKTVMRRDSNISREISECFEGNPISSRSARGESTRVVLQSGAFAGLRFPFQSARANAAYVMREHIYTYLITHPHLDHISAFSINTGALHNTARPKKLAALPSTVNAIKTHIFNDIIWPNLTDEDGGVGLVTFQRLVDGGNIAVGEDCGKGYIEVCEGLCVRGMKISHGACLRKSSGSANENGMGWTEVPSTKVSHHRQQQQRHHFRSLASARCPSAHTQIVQSEISTPNAGIGDYIDPVYVMDSTAYFIRDSHSHRELLFFGDVEPDSISLIPRTANIWAEAAPKIASRRLKAVFIECSYDDSRDDSTLFGHLAPRHLICELEVLARMVKHSKADHHKHKSKKRKRQSGSDAQISQRFGSRPMRTSQTAGSQPASSSTNEGSAGKRRRQSTLSSESVEQSTASDSEALSASTGLSNFPPESHRFVAEVEPPLKGLKIVVIHVKDTFEDGPLIGESICKQLEDHEARLKDIDGLGLGCEFVMSTSGNSYYF